MNIFVARLTQHQDGVNRKKAWIESKLQDGHVFRKLNARGKTFIEYEPIETAWVPVVGKNYEYIYCLWVAGSFKGQGIAKELLDYAINDEVKELSAYAKEKNFKLNFVKIDSLEKAKNAPCIFNNWANFYQGKFISNTILNAKALGKLSVFGQG